jgi:hypothetical protein
VTGAPVPGDAGACVFTIDRFVTGAASTTATPFVVSVVVEHGLAAITNPVFDTAVVAHTTPYRPLIVNVVVVPGKKLSPAADVHSNRVPDAMLVTTAAGQPAGVTAAAPTTTGDIVSSTVRFVIVAPPVFVTTIE